MLYQSTRNKVDSFTAYRALRMDRAPDGGFLVPMRIPTLDDNQVKQMVNGDFLQNVADVLNVFFGTRHTSWDVESAIGKQPIQSVACGQKITLAHCWKNPRGNISYYVDHLFLLLLDNKDVVKKPTVWAEIAIRIALIASMIFSCHKQEKMPIDVAVNAGDFKQAFAVYCCRMMGVPIRKIVISCNENSGIWDFVYHGTIHCGTANKKTDYPAMDNNVPDLFEPFLYLSYGISENDRFRTCLNNNSLYQLSEEAEMLSLRDVFVSVVGGDRIPTVMASFTANNGISISPYTAFSLGALQDYRAKAGEGNPTIVLEEESP